MEVLIFLIGMYLLWKYARGCFTVIFFTCLLIFLLILIIVIGNQPD